MALQFLGDRPQNLHLFLLKKTGAIHLVLPRKQLASHPSIADELDNNNKSHTAALLRLRKLDAISLTFFESIFVCVFQREIN